MEVVAWAHGWGAHKLHTMWIAVRCALESATYERNL